MKKDRYLSLDREGLNRLFEFNLRKIQLVDGLWFLHVEDRFGTQQAIDSNCAVWAEVGRRDARRARDMLGVRGEGIPALIEALQKTFMAFADWEMEQVSPNHAIFRATTCYPQKARVEKGRGVYDCRSTEEAFFTGYAQGIDAGIKVRCGFCPPEKYAGDLWCEWHFCLGEEPF